MSNILNINEDELKSVDLFELAGLNEWQPNVTICEGYSPYSGGFFYVRTSENAISITPAKTIVLTDKSTFHSGFNILTTQQFYYSSSSLMPQTLSSKPTAASFSIMTDFNSNIKKIISKSVVIDKKYSQGHEFSSLISSSLNIKDSVKEMLSLKDRVSKNLNKNNLFLKIP